MSGSGHWRTLSKVDGKVSVPICGFPCHYGGLSMARKHSRSDLGWMWHCNRSVKTPGERCWQHAGEPEPEWERRGKPEQESWS